MSTPNSISFGAVSTAADVISGIGFRYRLHPSHVVI